MQVPVRLAPQSISAKLPVYQSEGSSGFDFHADLGQSVSIYPGESEMIPTGFYIAVPKGYELQVRSRSGLAAKQNLMVLNSPGTVDADYRGEVKVILYNASKEVRHIHPGDRIAQGVIAPVIQIEMVEVDKLSETERGDGGFGSTGT